MALKATVYKAELTISDMDRGYYATHHLTIARHPSETDERMMLRLAAFARHASDTLEFGRGISDEDDAALWQKTLTDDIELWIELGQPDEKRIKHACQRAEQVWVYTYGNRVEDTWWKKIEGQVCRFANLHVAALDGEQFAALGRLAERTMRISATIQDGELFLANGQDDIQLQFRMLQGGQ
ncbi:YaeQ family protein [Chitinilyticum litopenaei]|uniref:YaeQ family protein n=1 Tax=Chitinilyticum litopenaei TaxID=1121276 RepID=UPI0003F8026E|nr:YaeQ family protein [Chitinilyticum litopenaei]